MLKNKNKFKGSTTVNQFLFLHFISDLYSIIDIEATGGNSKIGRMTEVAIYKFDGTKVVDEFHSLVNPECSIPSFVQGLTGITDHMAKKAPKFFEIAKDIVEITQGTCFVAHNVKFDYSFFQMEFESLGYEFKSNRLCTLELSKLLLPGHDSYSLGKLCKSLGIQLQNRHRASGDALATVELFKRILDADQDNTVKRKLRRH